MKTLLSLLVATAGIALSASLAPAQAYSLSSSTACESGLMTGYSDCSGSYQLEGGENDVTDGGADNIVSQLLNEEALFGNGDEGWTFGAKYDGGWSGDNEAEMSVTGLGSTSGTFDFSNLDLATTDLAVSLKAAKGFSIYYIAAGSIMDASEISWSTDGTSTNKKGVAQGLSHISYYTRIAESIEPENPPVRKVPEPTALSALFAVGAAAVIRRKQLKQPKQ